MARAARENSTALALDGFEGSVVLAEGARGRLLIAKERCLKEKCENKKEK